MQALEHRAGRRRHPTSDLIPDEFRTSHIAQPLRSGLRNMMTVWEKDEFVLDPSRITLSIGRTGCRFEQRVRRLTTPSSHQPDFSGFHEVFRDLTGGEATPEGDVRRAFYLSYNDANCEYLTGEEIDEKLDTDIDVVSATFVTPYPPGFPVLVPGQVFSHQILSFIRNLDTPEIHGYKADFGYRVYTEKAIENCGSTMAPYTNGHGPMPADPAEPASTQV